MWIFSRELARETDWVTQFEGFFRALGWVVGYEKWVMPTEVSDSTGDPTPTVGRTHPRHVR